MGNIGHIISLVTITLLTGTACIAREIGSSPDGNLCLVLEELANGNPPRLNLVDTHTSKTIASASLETFPVNQPKAVWSNRNDAVAVAVDYTTTNSKAIGFLRLSDGEFKSLILEQANLGKFGEPYGHWIKIRNFPVAWDTMSNIYNDRFIDVRTQVWDKSGQRFTVTESVRITPSGVITGR